MDRVLKSLKEQERMGTLTRNTRIALRVEAGEKVGDLAEEFGLSRNAIYQIALRHARNREEAKAK